LAVNASGWEDLAGKLTDGASFLGYENGDILRATGKGESFASIVSSSPFAEKLNAVNRRKLDEALEDSKMIADRVAQTSREKRGDSSPAEDAAPRVDQSPESDVSSPHSGLVGAETDGLGVIRTGISPTAAANGTNDAGETPSAAEGTSAPPASTVMALKRPAQRLTEAQRIEAIQLAATRSRLAHEPYRGPASASENAAPAAAPETLADDLSLFQRVSRTYRKRSPWLNPLGERAGDRLRSMAKPEIFRGL
jgi:hypothetical protein